MLGEFHHVGSAFAGMGVLGAHRDSSDLCDESTSALLEFARENLLLKRELHIANSELTRLQTVVQAHEMQKKGPQYNSEDEPKSQRRYWTDQEHERFLDAIQNFGHKNVKAISAYVGTRSATQVRTHAQKYFLKAARENKAREKATAMIQVDSSVTNNATESENGGRR
jgi:SHAQKYF class myb-like DNA-binding protein